MNIANYREFTRLFMRYFAVGLINTSVHWAVFFLIFYRFHNLQMIANFIAFCCSTSCNIFLNARWTFNSSVTMAKYISFFIFIGSLSLLTGYIADHFHIPSLITLIVFSGTCLIGGFLFSKYVVFKDTKPLTISSQR
ncbi:Putative flippase GtrA (transmembrane translocase of bactoprenol-linked glucose) (GtrA) (PDB:5MLZ) (PUBMED:24710389) [Commensalibacter communis]|uniref:GtrA family protein n=2 Tax=Commensalibacter communis TaxID=2972786 RepID=UPI0022FF78F4|nr:Putative flippase GtrA (transmembrane translocase of bactoprenol-linked glucose) (GtrA) (PDB:5MLZ) (PUBMED:24710389) [Commensalibacter communis]CAI3958219.1 Putative flippase GtrA (transmembrane translocase of bactoprenol-linked glucose) (GtrA) (PDB:5MLZ) (PUBMED:24710389) [Commensalibacter communis]